MPILPKETCLHPKSVLDSGILSWIEPPSDDPEAQIRSWKVIHTLPKQEKSLARELVRRDLPFYLPLIEKRRLVSGANRSSYLPVFPGYLFLCCNELERSTVLNTGRVSAFLPVVDQRELIHELRNLRLLIDSGAPVSLESRLQPGDRVRVTTGQFRDLEGSVIRRKGKSSRLLVSVSYLQQGISLELPDHCLERID